MTGTKSLELGFRTVYNKFKLNFYQSIFSRFETREASLSAVETFCIEVINSLEEPTINEFARFVKISQANAAYKVQSLIRKGYVTKVRSEQDRREFILRVTDKFYVYSNISDAYVDKVMSRMRVRFPAEDIEKFSEMLDTMATELMPETEKGS